MKFDISLEKIINAIADGIFVKDREHRWVLMNDANLEYTGKDREAMVGKSDFHFFPKDQADIFWEKDELVFKTGEENINEEEITDRQGKKMVVLTRKTLLEDEKGNKYIVGVSRDITERKKMEEKLRETLRQVQNLSLTDELTGLYNRRGFKTLAVQQFKIAARKETYLAILYIDVNRMKQINDEFGHREGDRALTRVADILKATFRDSDIIARVGGDEFVVLAINSAKSDVSGLLNTLRQGFHAENKKFDSGYVLSVSVGTAYYDAEHPSTVDKLLAAADEAMYEDKKKLKPEK